MKEKKKRNIGSIILLIIAIGLIGVGSYLMYTDKLKVTEDDSESKNKIVEEKLDVKNEDVKNALSILQLENISNEYVGDLKDFYYNNDSISDDLKLFLILYTFDDIEKVKAGEISELTITVDEIKTNSLNIFEKEIDEKNYKTISLADGLVANWNEDKKEYSIVKSGEEKPKDSRYYGELVSAIKFDNQIILTVKSFYASLESNGDGESIYVLYSNSDKQNKVSEKEYEDIPKISDSNINKDSLGQYQFIFKDVKGKYKFDSFVKTN